MDILTHKYSVIDSIINLIILPLSFLTSTLPYPTSTLPLYLNIISHHHYYHTYYLSSFFVVRPWRVRTKDPQVSNNTTSPYHVIIISRLMMVMVMV